MRAEVRTVRGPITTDRLGVTLSHEHVLIDGRPLWHAPAPDDDEAVAIAHAPLGVEHLGRLRNDPMLSLDNVQLFDERAAIDELGLFRAAGGATLVDQTGRGMGRDPAALCRVSEATGLNIVMGSGFYVEPGHPSDLAAMSVSQLAEEIERDLVSGAEGSGIRAGVIGEVGVSSDFTPLERRSLEAAAAAQARVHVPLFVHLPGWRRDGHAVLDVVEASGGDVHATVLCHMTPSLADPAYQHALADRGAWLGYDMVGMDYLYPGDRQCPGDEDIARAVVALLEAGYGDRLLLSGDVFLKMMLVRHGGFGYAHVITTFADRLRRHGLDQATLDGLFVANPAALFEQASGPSRGEGR